MAEQQKRMRTSSGGSTSFSASSAIVKREGEVEQRVVIQAGIQAGATAAPTDQQGSTQGDDSSKFMIVFVDRDRWLHCAACSGPLKTPVYKCGAAGHKVCCTCRGDDSPVAKSRCRACNGAAASFTLCSDDFQELIGSHRVACPYKAYGCRRLVSYLTVDEHRRACPDKPCSCFELAAGCDGGFLGSPRTLHDHLVGPLHWWPTRKIEYGKTQILDVLVRRRLLASEGEERVFVLAVAEDSTAGMTNVSLMCLRSSAAAAAGPHYRARLWSHAPRDPVTGVEERLEAEFVVESRESPCEIAVREGTLLPLQPKFLRGASRKIVLYVRIDKLKPMV
ncbi:hypothetical protein ACQ4PT_066612 [Festuca glaucescens]